MTNQNKGGVHDLLVKSTTPSASEIGHLEESCQARTRKWVGHFPKTSPSKSKPYAIAMFFSRLKRPWNSTPKKQNVANLRQPRVPSKFFKLASKHAGLTCRTSQSSAVGPNITTLDPGTGIMDLPG